MNRQDWSLPADRKQSLKCCLNLKGGRLCLFIFRADIKSTIWISFKKIAMRKGLGLYKASNIQNNFIDPHILKATHNVFYQFN